MGVEVDEELAGEERGKEGVDGVESVRKLAHRRKDALLSVAGIEDVVVLGRDGVDDKVLPGGLQGSVSDGWTIHKVKAVTCLFVGTGRFRPAPSKQGPQKWTAAGRAVPRQSSRP